MIAEKNIEQFRGKLQGEFINPKDEAYEDARKVWNGMIDKHPMFIVKCADTMDVVYSVDFARNNNLEIAVRGGAHNVAGFSTCDGGIVIDLSPMKKIEINKASATASAQAGLTWGEFDNATQKYGLATTGGLVTTTGIAGFTLGGGFGWLVRKYGMTIDNLLSVEIVLANGKLITASANENSDLFWGVRGGGGNFGIVTSFTFKLHPVGPNVFGGALFYPFSKAKDLLHFYNKWTKSLPDELSTMTAFITAPPEPFVPNELIGSLMLVVALCYSGEIDEGANVLRPLREFMTPAIDIAGPIPYIALQGMFDASAPKGMYSYWKTVYLNELSDNAIDTFIEKVSNLNKLSPFAAVHIHHWEGAVKQVKSEETAFSYRDARFVMNIIGMWTPGGDSDKNINWVRDFSDAAQQFSTGKLYLNFLADTGEDKVVAAYGREKYDKLTRLKNKYDPENIFHLNQNIKPSLP